MLAFRIGVVSGLISLLTWPSMALASPPEPASEPAASEPAASEPAASEPAPSWIEPVTIEIPAPEPKPEAATPKPEAPAVAGEPVDPSHHDNEARPAEEKLQIPVDVGDRHSITYTSLLAPRINPLGLEERLWIGYQYRLYDKPGDIWKGSNLGIFLRPILSPAIGLIGPTVQVQPLAVLRLRATWSFVGWLGTFDYMQSYQSP